jgi:2-methylcitrate dehydratase PrpD
MNFADFVLGVTADDLPPEVIEQARRQLLDLIGVAAAGRGTTLSSIIVDHAAEQFGPGGKAASILFDGRMASPTGAALAGGMIIDSLDAHDGHKLTKGHAGCGLFPSVLAIAEAEGLEDGREFMARIALGYEIGVRAGMALHATAPDYHTSGAWVAVSCAALGARALGLDAERLRHAVGIAEYHGPRSQMMRVIDHPTMLKDGSGFGAMAGTSAAHLARAGFTGAPAITVEGADVAATWLDLGSRWRIFEQYVKPHPVCRWAQPAVEASMRLMAQYRVDATEVAGIAVETFHEAVRLAARRPQSTEEAQYSLPFPVAAAIARGRLGPAEVTGEALRDPVILAMADRVELIENHECNTAFPAHRFASVTLKLKDGRWLNSGMTEARGDPEAPFDDDFMRGKYRDYAGPTLGETRAKAIEEAVDGLASGRTTVSRLVELLAPPPG